MEVANTLVYYDAATITVVKSFIVQAPIELFLPWLFIAAAPAELLATLS
jgi:hypothetical protein